MQDKTYLIFWKELHVTAVKEAVGTVLLCFKMTKKVPFETALHIEITKDKAVIEKSNIKYQSLTK